MRRITAITVGRSDWGIWRPVLQQIRASPGLSLHLIAAGGHWSAASGATWREIVADGFSIDDRVEMNLASDTPVAVAKSMGLGVIGFAEIYARVRPDIVLLLGDRFEMFAAAAAAVPLAIPLAHVHGGEVTHGAIDEGFRHAITKLSHLHFASTEEHANRIAQLGEEPWRITVSGAPALDNLASIEWLSLTQLEQRLGMALAEPPLVVTFHPVTLQGDRTGEQAEALVAALQRFSGPLVVTHPNADPRAGEAAQPLRELCRGREQAVFVENLGTQAYFSLLRHAGAMVGNSSSGVIEAASFELPVVNVGIRQAGRPRSANVIDSQPQAEAIVRALDRALSPQFRAELAGLENVYGDGQAASRIVERIRTVPLNERLLIKQFVDQPLVVPTDRLTGATCQQSAWTEGAA